MTDANARPGSPPQPPVTPEALRAVLAHIAPDRLSAFDVEHVAALASARSAISAIPLIRFAEQWALYVAIERHPAWAVRLRELEAQAAVVDDRDQARSIAAEMRTILVAATAEAGLDRGVSTT